MAAGDLLFVALAAGHGAAILALPVAPAIALGVWWNSNTIAHNFIHRPFFRTRALNVIFSACQSVLLGIPQTLWRERHLAHHAGRTWRWQWSPQLAAETTLVCASWASLALLGPRFFLTVYVPGYLAGLLLCAMQGHFEHAGGTTSHYGRIYNALCFNDGFHAEHHAYPGVHWRALPRRKVPGTRVSRLPPLLRWIDATSLDALERLVLTRPWLQRYLLAVHRRAFRTLLAGLPPPRRIGIVGGGLFPRTAIVLRELVPAAHILVIDASAANIETAHRLIGASVAFRHGFYSPGDAPAEFDLLVFPLAFQGDRSAIYRRPPAPAVLVHDWAWRRRGRGRLVSLTLFKRVNLVGDGVRGEPASERTLGRTA